MRTQRTRCALVLGAMLCLPLLSHAAQTPPAEPTATATGQDVDNSRMNQRDRSDANVTAGDQTNDKADIQVAADVRRAIVKDKSLSTSAHNVKLIARAGTVTLRGPVKSADEKAKVEQIAGTVAGVKQVQNDLDVKADQH
jgi:osmotically-inducible protein OsmY